MSYGKAEGIKVEQFGGFIIDEAINKWLKKNPNIEILDINFTTIPIGKDIAADALVVYRVS